MIPNMHIHEQLMFERQKEMQRVLEQRRLLAGIPGHHLRLRRHPAATLAAFLQRLGSYLKPLEVREGQATRATGTPESL